MFVPYEIGAGAPGQIGFTGHGDFVAAGDSHLSVDASTRLITINP